jgi:hypothetical protein
MDAKDQIENRDNPEAQRGLFKIGNAIQARRNPIARRDHIAGNLGRDRIHVIHQRRRTNNAGEEKNYEANEEEKRGFIASLEQSKHAKNQGNAQRANYRGLVLECLIVQYLRSLRKGENRKERHFMDWV